MTEKKTVITIRTDNAAFCDADGEYSGFSRNTEIARMLRQLASELEQDGCNYRALLDNNGNSVGSFVAE